MWRSRTGELLVALAADAALADPGDGAHPVAWFGRCAGWLERRWWQDRRVAGVRWAGALIGVAIAVGQVAEHVPFGGVLAAWVALGGATLRARALSVAAALEEGDLERARSELRWLVGRDRDQLDAAEIARAAIESVADNTADAVLGVVVWHMIAGARGSLGLRAVNTLDAMAGHHTARYERFGWAAARLDDLAMWPVSRLALLLSPPYPWALLRAARGHASPNAGVMEALAAAAVGVRLGGENRYGERLVVAPTLVGGPPPDAEAIRRSVAWSRQLTIRTVLVEGPGARGAGAAALGVVEAWPVALGALGSWLCWFDSCRSRRGSDWSRT